jgi:hypothetical protein
MIEEWRAVVGFEGSYEVSNLGRVRSVDRIEIWVRTIRGQQIIGERKFKGKLLTPTAKAAGHMHLSLGRGNRVYVHHLVLEAFVGPAPARHECLHWDDHPENNRLDNLRWGTRAENLADFERNYGRRQRGIERAVTQHA